MISSIATQILHFHESHAEEMEEGIMSTIIDAPLSYHFFYTMQHILRYSSECA